MSLSIHKGMDIVKSLAHKFLKSMGKQSVVNEIVPLYDGIIPLIYRMNP